MAIAPSASSLRPDRVVLPGGLTLVHSRTPSNPSVVTRVLLRAGAARESNSRQGLASFTGRMLRQGSQSISKDALAEELDGLGAGLSIDVGYALTTASMKCLSQDFDRTTALLSAVLLGPTFPREDFERIRGQVLTDLRELDDSTRMQAERVFRELAYPAGHRYHRLPSGTPESVSNFTPEETRRFHEQFYGPNQATVVVVGDIPLEHAVATLGAALSAWQPVNVEQVEQILVPTPVTSAARSDFAMSGKTQADVVLGTTTMDRHNPDYYALSFANHILGRMYFMGRFGEKVRDEQGLAYYAYSDLSAGFGSGPWTVRAGVNPRNLGRALESIASEIARFLADGATEQEHEDGIRSILGSLPRGLETNEGTAAVLGEMELYGLGLDYLERYPDIIRSLEREQVVEAARRWIHPENLLTAVAGPAAAE